MPAIDFRGSAKPAGSRITLKWVLAILASVTLVFFGTTFASNLNLNSSNRSLSGGPFNYYSESRI